MANADTFPKILEENAVKWAGKPAMREKEFGIWQTATWSQARDNVRDMACGFASLGLERGDKIAVIGDNRPNLYWAMAAAQAIGAIPVPVYQDSAAPEMKFVLEHAEVRFALGEDQEQVDKLVEIIGDCPTLETVIFDQHRGMRNYDMPNLHSLEEVTAKGRELQAEKPDFYAAETAKSKGSDTAIIMYTSGTTGQPKGVLLSFDNLIVSARNHLSFEEIRVDDDVLAYLPPAWVGDNFFAMAESYVAGFCVNCPESAATVTQDLREIGPTYFFAPPAIFESILTTVTIRMQDAGWLKRKAFDYFMKLAGRVGVSIMEGNSVSAIDRLLYWLGGILIYGPLKNTLGFSRVRLAYTAGEAIGPDIFDFFRSLGMNLKQLYGSTESSVVVTMQPDGDVRADTVGVAVDGVEIKIDDSGELLFRSAGVFQEYFKDPKATSETKTDDGWVRTGDAGLIDPDGHLKIIDRAKDVGKLADGTMFAPKYIENKLKFFPYVREAVAFGADREFVTVMISIDLEAVGNWAERNALAYSGYQDLAGHARVYDVLQENIEQVNADLADDAALVGSQIHRFVLLHKELDADDGELTRTRKVRRKFITEKYEAILGALYSGADHVNVEAEMTFEDGRTGLIKADLVIRDAKTVDTTPEMRKAS
jgi:long-chain acyl-CoA synthetase